ncbi:unnamed protein product, partial [Meganyctiphanes norvegica]
NISESYTSPTSNNVIQEVKNDHGSDLEGAALSELDFRFLYNRLPLSRKDSVVLLHGPPKWTAMVSNLLISVKIFGPFDTLVLVPTHGYISSKLVLHELPLGTRLAIIHGSLLQAVKLAQGGKSLLRTVGYWK